MLLPAFSCDSARLLPEAPVTRLQAALASPPASPPQQSSQNAIGDIYSTCRSLQALLSHSQPATEPTTPPTTSHSQLPTPPMAHAPSPIKLRLRSHKQQAAGLGLPTADGAAGRRRIVKRPAPHRGPNKRRRDLDDDMGKDDLDTDSDMDSECDKADTEESALEASAMPQPPHTPKRARIAPEVLPLGLGRSDYHTLHANGVFGNEDVVKEGTDIVTEEDGEKWSAEDDRILVELVLEKLKLSKAEWQDCAKSLGKDRTTLGRRWKSLMVNGQVGLRRSSRRAMIHGTWR